MLRRPFMSYRYSAIDERNLRWFPRDASRATLLAIKLVEGHLRGLYPFEMTLQYPISAIAGKNGSGKTTILALAACAFHNTDSGFTAIWRRIPYYTFSDFFIQAQGEVPPDGITIRCQILHNNWKKSSRVPTGIGPGWQERRKPHNGKWSKYSRRVQRDVVYFGINRVVPHAEKSVSRNYRRYFERADVQGWEAQVANIVGRILNRNYDSFWYAEHTQYRLPMVSRTGCTYSGFNMGAGENVLFEIFSTIFSCPQGVLLVIDEIELGLHEEAQARLINELKRLCNERKIQVICTTHSYNVLKNLPPQALFFVENIGNKTILTQGITPEFAAGKLTGENSNELDIFVEDTTAKALIESCLTNQIRTRTNTIPIGSSSAILRQLAARFKEHKHGDCLAIMDGDKSGYINQHCMEFMRYLENIDDEEEANNWVRSHILFLPGSTWPENWTLEQIKDDIPEDLLSCFSISSEVLKELLEEAIRAGKHNEYYSLAEKMNLDLDYVRSVFSTCVSRIKAESFQTIRDSIDVLLDAK
jgi:predicted ATPase